VHEGHEVVGWVPREILERPVSLRAGVGNIHEKATTSSPQAQSFYDQGLNYLSSYVWIEAARSFHQALRLDPNFAMGYVGLCDVHVELQDVPAARAALEEAQKLADRVTEQERQRIEIRARQIEFLEDRKDVQKFIAYRKAIYDALMANPGDPGLWILRGFADEGPAVGHGQTGDVDSIAFYETALAVSPDNSAAHHYLAHSFENIGRNQEALKHSEAYLGFARSIPHAHHMRGHALRRAGRIEEAIEEFRNANELENAYYRAEHIAPQYDWHRAHNLSLLALCHQLLGQVKTAEKLLREAFSLAAHSEVSEFNRKQWPEFLLERGRTQEAFDAAQDMFKSPSSMARFAGHILAGRTLLTMNQMDAARSEWASARQELQKVPDSDRLAPFAETLRAEILLNEKKSAEGTALMKQVEESLRAAPGPDARSQSLFQLDSIARRARDTEEWALAEFTAREMIEEDPSYAGGYYALGLVSEHQANPVAASQNFAAAEKLWSEADTDLPELRSVRQKLAMQQSEVHQTRREFLKGMKEHSGAPVVLQPAKDKVEVAYDPARLRGSPHAPIMIVEFSDFQCPFCRKVQATLNSLLKKHEGQVSLAYRDFPLREMHPKADLGAESSRCASEQGKFWEYHDLLFTNPDKLNRPGVTQLARSLNLDEKQFDSCLSAGKYRKQIEQDVQDGIRAGVQGTPSIFINGILLSGAQPEAEFEKIVEAELATRRDKRKDP